VNRVEVARSDLHLLCVRACGHVNGWFGGWVYALLRAHFKNEARTRFSRYSTLTVREEHSVTRAYLMLASSTESPIVCYCTYCFVFLSWSTVTWYCCNLDTFFIVLVIKNAFIWERKNNNTYDARIWRQC